MRYLPVLFLWSGFLLFGYDAKDFERVVDFSVTIETLGEITDGNQPFDPEKLVIVEGTIDSVLIENKNADVFSATADLVKGIWNNLEEIQVNRCVLRFSGPEFAGRVTGRIVNDPAVIGLNDHVLVVGKLVIETSAQGNRRPVILVSFIRSL